MLKVEYIRDGHNQIIGSKTSSLAGGVSVARDREGRILGSSSDWFHTTRDKNGCLVSQNTADVDLLFRK